jgi:hypothetical protein
VWIPQGLVLFICRIWVPLILVPDGMHMLIFHAMQVHMQA